MNEFERYLPHIDKLPDADKRELLKLLDEYEQAVSRESAQTEFMPFVRKVWPGFIEGKHHRQMAEAFEKVARGELKRVIISMPPRHTKALALDTPIRTPTGWTTVSELAVGDFVYGADGKKTKVIGKSEVFQDRELYEVVTDDGAAVVCDADHKWTVRLDRNLGRWGTFTTEQLWRRECGEVLCVKSGVAAFRKGFVNSVRAARLPDSCALSFETKTPLPLDPYLFGVWVGDGHASKAIIAMNDEDASIVRAEIERRGYKTTNQSTKNTFGVLNIKTILRDMGVLGNKSIPEKYLFASDLDRMDLLRGLMDSDGCVSKAGQCFFGQKNKGIIDAVCDLVRSLGGKPTIQEYEVEGHGTHYKVSFYLKDCAFLPRKRERTVASKAGRFIRVRKLGKRGPTQCITVAARDGLFLAGRGLVVTHNSEFASYLLPAWFLGMFPHKKIIQASNTSELAVGFGRKVRNLLGDKTYKDIFPGVELSPDSKAAGRWSTNKGGEYFAVGVGGTVTGKGADIFIVDDPHSEQEAATAESNPEVYDRVYDWYTSGPRQRLQPNGSIIIVMTRWSKRDLVGRVLKKSMEIGGEDWHYIELPAILPSGDALWPEFWSINELKALEAELPLPKWMAQYQQKPTSSEGAILKKEWWQEWPEDSPPVCDFIIQSWDTAYTKGQRSDFSACTTWGVFNRENPVTGVKAPNLILLDAFQERMEFPDLKVRALKMYDEWQPDAFIIEAKAAGAPLVFELRQMGIPVEDFTPSRGNDKIVRANAVSDIFSSKIVWYPPTRWAEEVIEQCAEFPAGEHDDLVDSTTQALLRFRQGGFIRTITDEEDEEVPFNPRRKYGYF